MQTFLISHWFSECAQVLDNLRLRKQLIEYQQIKNTLTGKSQGWKMHPAVIQWTNFVFALDQYGTAISEECKKRGFSSFTINIEQNVKMPPWLSDERLHSSHRAKLLYKGRCDAICHGVKSYLGVFSINNWLIENNFSQKNQLQIEDILVLEEFARQNNIKVKKNWYEQFGWSEPNDNSVPYFWPSKQLEYQKS